LSLKNIKQLFQSSTSAVKPVYNSHHLDTKKVAVLKIWLLLTVCNNKIAINFGELGIRLVVVGMWP
jgi:hypothetical protein